MQTEFNITAFQLPSDPISRPSSSSTQLSSDSAEPTSDADLTSLGADLATSEIGKTPFGSTTIVNAAPGEKKKQKAEPVTVVKKERRRNFTVEEVQVIMQKAGKNTTVIKGRFTPTITSEAKKKVWISIKKSLNSINGKEDREWRDVRKKWIDTSCSTRTKLRIIDKEQRKTGGGTSSAPPLSKVESLAAVSRSGRSLATSGGLISYSNLLLNDISNKSEISFDLYSNPRSSTAAPRFPPLTLHSTCSSPYRFPPLNQHQNPPLNCNPPR